MKMQIRDIPRYVEACVLAYYRNAVTCSRDVGRDASTTSTGDCLSDRFESLMEMD